MGGVRENCRWIPGPVMMRPNNPGIDLFPFDNPDLLKAVDALKNYISWVDEKLVPIASKWIEEHREEVIKDMTPAQMNDMGAAIDKAFSIVAQSEWYKEQMLKAETYDYERALQDGRANPLWINADTN